MDEQRHENEAAPSSEEEVLTPEETAQIELNIVEDTIHHAFMWRVRIGLLPPAGEEQPPRRQRILQFISPDGTHSDTYPMPDELAQEIGAWLTEEPKPVVRAATAEEMRRMTGLVG